jgi:hypothetical protein
MGSLSQQGDNIHPPPPPAGQFLPASSTLARLVVTAHQASKYLTCPVAPDLLPRLHLSSLKTLLRLSLRYSHWAVVCPAEVLENCPLRTYNLPRAAWIGRLLRLRLI